MVETKKVIVKLPRVGCMTLVGFMNIKNEWPMLEGNCFSMLDRSVDCPPVELQHALGRVVNMRAEDFQYLAKNSPDLIENLEVEVITPYDAWSGSGVESWIFITDERIKDWLVADVCSVCVPSVIKEYLENRGEK